MQAFTKAASARTMLALGREPLSGYPVGDHSERAHVVHKLFGRTEPSHRCVEVGDFDEDLRPRRAEKALIEVARVRLADEDRRACGDVEGRDEAALVSPLPHAEQSFRLSPCLGRDEREAHTWAGWISHFTRGPAPDAMEGHRVRRLDAGGRPREALVLPVPPRSVRRVHDFLLKRGDVPRPGLDASK